MPKQSPTIDFLISEFTSELKNIIEGNDPMDQTEYVDWYESHFTKLKNNQNYR